MASAHHCTGVPEDEQQLILGGAMVRVSTFAVPGAFGDSYVPQVTPYNQRESVTSSCYMRSHRWDMLKWSCCRFALYGFTPAAQTHSD